MPEDWKGYLQSRGLLIGNDKAAFAAAMQTLEQQLTDRLPSIQGMIWQNGQVNPKATVADVKEALFLLDKFGVANFDALGPPGEDSRSNIFNNMFISQEDSKINEYNPQNNQNAGTWKNDVPKKLRDKEDSILEEKPQKNRDNIDQRMRGLTKLIEDVKKYEDSTTNEV